MGFARNKLTVRMLMAVTVACGLAVSACSKEDETRKFARIDPKALHAPVNNPSLEGGRVVAPAGARKPQENGDLGTGSDYAMKANAAPQIVPGAGRDPEPENKGWFGWVPSFGDEKRQAPEVAPAPAQRKTPALNHEGITPGVVMAPATYQAADAGHVDVNPVTETDTQVFAASQPPVAPDAAHNMEQAAMAQTAPVMEEVAPVQAQVMAAAPDMQHEFAPAEPTELAGLPPKKQYPSLSTVPPRPERLDTAGKASGEKFAEMEQAHQVSVARDGQLEAQIAADGAPTSMAQEGYAGIQGYEGEVQIAAAPAGEAPAAADSYAWQSAAARNAALPEQSAEGVPMAADPVSPAPVQMAAPITQEAPAAMAQAPQIEVVEEQVQAVVVEEPAPQAAAAAPVSPAAAPHEMIPVVAEASPATPVAAPQAEMAAVPQNEWVEIQQPDAAAQAAALVENMEVAAVPETQNVPLSPEAESGIALTPPYAQGTAVRQLPESRYAARRQAVYAQQYARRAAVDRVNAN